MTDRWEIVDRIIESQKHRAPQKTQSIPRRGLFTWACL
jgi:hypothetical protein